MFCVEFFDIEENTKNTRWCSLRTPCSMWRAYVFAYESELSTQCPNRIAGGCATGEHHREKTLKTSCGQKHSLRRAVCISLRTAFKSMFVGTVFERSGDFAQMLDGATCSTMKSCMPEWEACLPIMVWKASSRSLAERMSHSWVFLLFSSQDTCGQSFVKPCLFVVFIRCVNALLAPRKSSSTSPQYQ